RQARCSMRQGVYATTPERAVRPCFIVIENPFGDDVTPVAQAARSIGAHMNDAHPHSANVDPMVAVSAAGAATSPLPRRVVAVDVFRGLVILILVPDVLGGFSFFRVAHEFPDSTFWSSLGAA